MQLPDFITFKDISGMSVTLSVKYTIMVLCPGPLAHEAHGLVCYPGGQAKVSIKEAYRIQCILDEKMQESKLTESTIQ